MPSNGLVTKHQAELAVAAQGRTIVAKQRALVDRMKVSGHQIEMHERTLSMFEMTLRSFEDHERVLRELVAEDNLAEALRSSATK